MSRNRVLFKYGCGWTPGITAAEIEIECIRRGGEWDYRNKKCGRGLFYHIKELQKILWPYKDWHRWNDLLLKSFVKSRIIGILGPASSGKSHESALYALCIYYCFPHETTVLVSSTEREMLEMRIWGEIKKHHKMAKERFPSVIPGELLESRQRIVTDSQSEAEYEEDDVQGRDFRNGVCGVPCKKGGNYVGLGCFSEGTLVDTPNGKVPIENIRIGDEVLNAIGIGRVKATSVRLADTIIRVNGNGWHFDCTPEHPVLTSSGWVSAIDIGPEHELITTHEAMCTLHGNYTEPETKQEILLQEMQGRRRENREKMHCLPENASDWHSWSDEVLLERVPVNYVEESVQDVRKGVHSIGEKDSFLREVLLREMDNEPRGHQGKSIKQQEFSRSREKTENVLFGASRAEAEDARSNAGNASEWNDTVRMEEQSPGTNNCGEDTQTSFSRSKTGILNQNRQKLETWESSTLQDGPCLAGNKTECGDRRTIPLKRGTDCEGQNTDRVFVRQRVVSIEVLKRPSSEKSAEGKEINRVYNIEVEGHPSYSVCGILVHNSLIGIKNKRVIMVADELQFMPKAFIDAISNLNKNPIFTCVGMGNPKDITDPLGMLCEPAPELGGWDGGIDQEGPTKVWKTRYLDGICVQLVGSDSPNFDAKPELAPPYPYLIKRSDIESDRNFYGADSLQFTMMDEGRMPRGESARRVITRPMCEKFQANGIVTWTGDKRTKIGFLDAAYGSVGGDRCVFGEIQFGKAIVEGQERLVLALIETRIVPVSVKDADIPEDQIARWVKGQCEQRDIPPHNFFFDSTGRGTLVSAFARTWSPSVVPIEFGGQPSKRMVSNERRIQANDYYSKRVTELWYQVRLTIEAGQFRGMTEDVMAEGCMREWTITKGNKIELESKDKTKVRMGRSPDLFDALVAGVEGAIQRGFRIGRLSPTSVLDKENYLYDFARRYAKAANQRQLSYR